LPIHPINFVPERSRILYCDYGMARVHPEIDKTRRVVVVSPRTYNERHGEGPGRCLVVPFSATHPGAFLTPSDVPFPAGIYECLTRPTWAVCSAVMSVSHARLGRVFMRGKPSDEMVSPDDMTRIVEGLRHAFGAAGELATLP
jgi:uncharacterized protein YifN (PemK superfamily)